jgi:hypothetical protein
MSEAPIQPISVTFHCNTCGGHRNHTLLTEHVREWKEEVIYEEEGELCGTYIGRKDVYILLRCCGCDSVSLKHESFSEAEEHPTIKTYPPRQFRQMPAWVQEIEDFVRWKGDANFAFIPRLLKEIYGSLYSEHRAVSAMGIRALLELIMIEKIGDRGSFRKNVEAFQNEGFISHLQRTLLDPTLEFGHASMHRNYAPKMTELIAALDITESLIHSLYILPDKAKSLSDAVPKRNRND